MIAQRAETDHAADRRAAGLEALIRADQLRGVRHSIAISFPVNVFLAIVTFAVMAGYGRPWQALAWLGAVVLVCLVRVLQIRSRPGPSPRGPAHRIKRHLDVAACLSGLTGLIWACTPLLPAEVGTETIFNLIVGAGITAGSISLGFAYARASIFFVTPILVSHAAWLASRQTVDGLFLAATIAVFLLAMVRSAMQTETSFVATTRLKHRARRLAQSLRQAHAETSAVAREMSHRALHDSLTGLANRAGFLKELERRAAAADETCCLMILDLDGFKAINDAFGHTVGDGVLAETARRIRPLLPPGALAARLGGDEFAILFGTAGAEVDPDAIAARLIAEIGVPVGPFHGGRLGVSIGLYVGAIADEDDVLVFADEALYAAKAAGRNRAYTFDETLRQRLVMRRDIKRDLAAALANGQMQLWYQPIFGDGGRRLCAVEALLRWQHPHHGWIAPPDIIAGASLAGQAEGLFRFVAEDACRMARRIRTLGREGVAVSLNVSPREMSQLPVGELLVASVEAAELPPGAIEIEITEETALDIRTVAAKLAALSAAGIRIAIDDFGVGYSSLASLRQLHADRIKIDRCFVTGLASSADNRMLLQAIIGLGRALELEVVAEGVESSQDVVILRALGCQFMQGYHLGRPMPADEILATLGGRPRDGTVSAA